ncbi:autotransporter outer membrane beta-barrel domain-containing protein [Bartonella sp. AD13SXNS]|uniref:autotransporter outer membrane beta-barrel domain-containing protein n=1 Tax=Bartonella sp. AD13SXNS TaxID=3243462 RepID=UPI0035D0DCEF
MSKKSLLSCTAVAAIMLFGNNLDVHAESLEVDKGEVKNVSNKTYEYIQTTNGGKVIGKNLTLTGGHPINNDLDAVVLRTKSSIELWDTTIKSANNTQLHSGVGIWHGSTFKMIGGVIAADYGVISDTDDSGTTILENVKLSSGKDNTSMTKGISAIKSIITLKNVTVVKAKRSIYADNKSQVMVSSGSFEAKEDAINAQSGSTITLDNEAKITSSEGDGLHAVGEQSKIFMTGGTVTGSNSVLYTKAGGYINVKDVALTANGKGTKFGAFARGSSTIELNGNTTIKNATIGVKAQSDNATIKMTGGSIEVTGGEAVGALFLDTTSKENTLKDVKISSGKDGFLMEKGINADNGSTVTLKNVTVTKAKRSIYADNKSQIMVSSGSFEAKEDAINAQSGSTITLDNEAKITSSEGDGLHAVGEQSKIFMTGGTVTGSNSVLYTKAGGYINVKDVALTANGKGTKFGAFARGSSTIELNGNTTIKNATIGVKAQSDNATIKMTGGSIEVTGGEAVGALFLETTSKENTLKDVKISSGKDGFLMEKGISADKGSTVTLKNVTVKNAEKALLANDNSQITVTGGGSFGGEVQTLKGSTITLNDNVTVTSDTTGLYADDEEAKITMTGGSVSAKGAAFVLKDGGHIDVTDISAKAQRNGLRFDNSKNDQTSEINLTNTNLLIEDGTGIVANNSSNGKLNLKDSEIRADRLFVGIIHDTPKHNQIFSLSADRSVLQGGVRNDENGQTSFDLKNSTTWFVNTSRKEKDDAGKLLDITQRSRSDVSVLNLNDSKIVFEKTIENHYHTLHIGSGKKNTPEVYNASGNAEIHFNMAWSDGVAVDDQKTDRVLIHGDASGTTTVYIKSDVGDKNSVENAAAPSNAGGISLIQVSGKAMEDSFKLANGYITRDGLPYKYILTAYGPESSHGTANIEQNLFDEKNENFWDFRLHKAFLDSGGGDGGSGGGSGGSVPGPHVEAVVPQVASYIVMPNALFYADFTDITKQSKLLADIRTTQNYSFFFLPYSSTATLTSERGPFKYGYGADIRYAAVQAGGALAAMESQNITMHFGLMGTYGQLSFTPKDMEGADKSTLNKWAVTAYGSIQHNNGLYVDVLASYGMIDGNITTADIKNAANLKGAKTLSASATIGKVFATGMAGIEFEPQAQIVYQQLSFDTMKDADNLEIDMKNPSQWLVRIGGRLTKTVSAESDHPFSFYGKVNFLKTFSDDGKIQIGREFDLDPAGTAIEGGLGINAQLSHNIALHGDVSYQKKLQKTGITGASFSGGIRYQF